MRERVAKARNGTGPQGGMFIPPAVGVETVSMPGNQGGSNWGTTAGEPEKGMVFVVGVNQVALLKLEDVKTREAGARARRRDSGNGHANAAGAGGLSAVLPGVPRREHAGQRHDRRAQPGRRDQPHGR